MPVMPWIENSSRTLLGRLFSCTTTASNPPPPVNFPVRRSDCMARIQALQSLRRTGKFTGGGGFEAVVVQENKRPSSVREEFSIQGMTGINAYDGKNGWKIEPWQGKRDAEALGEEEMHGILDDADFDGPLVNYQAKGNKVEYQGIEQIEGSDAYKLKVPRPNGDVSFYYLHTEYYVPIRVHSQLILPLSPHHSHPSPPHPHH